MHPREKDAPCEPDTFIIRLLIGRGASFTNYTSGRQCNNRKITCSTPDGSVSAGAAAEVMAIRENYTHCVRLFEFNQMDHFITETDLLLPVCVCVYRENLQVNRFLLNYVSRKFQLFHALVIRRLRDFPLHDIQ